MLSQVPTDSLLRARKGAMQRDADCLQVSKIAGAYENEIAAEDARGHPSAATLVPGSDHHEARSDLLSLPAIHSCLQYTGT